MENNCENSRKLIGLVLARGGSVSIPLKNLAILDNDTLLGRCLKTMQKSEVFREIWVSTDSEEILKEAKINGVRVHRREAHTATNEASSLSAVQEFLECNSEYVNSAICLVQCTSPFLSERYLREGFDMIRSGDFDSVFTASVSHQLRWSNGGSNKPVQALNFDPSNRPRRQSWSGEFVETGMFYIASARDVVEKGLLQTGKCGIVSVDREHSLDIDHPQDLVIAQAMIDFKRRQQVTK